MSYQPSKINIICKYNELRSPFSEIVLSKAFPQYLFDSYGTDIRDIVRYNRSLVEMLNYFQIQHSPNKPKSIFSDKTSWHDSEIYIAVDNYVFSDIVKIAELTNAICLSQFASRFGFSLTDPTNMSFNQRALELSKLLLSESCWINSQVLRIPNQVLGIVSLTSISYLEARNTALRFARENRAILIDANFEFDSTPYFKSVGFEDNEIALNNARMLDTTVKVVVCGYEQLKDYWQRMATLNSLVGVLAITSPVVILAPSLFREEKFHIEGVLFNMNCTNLKIVI